MENQQHTCMKLVKLLGLATLALALTTSNRLFADDSTTPTHPERPERPTEGGKRGENVRPGRFADVPNLGIPSKLDLPEDLQKLVDQFRTQAQTFVASQKELPSS